MDELVLQAQRWVNSTYAGLPGWVGAPEDGRTGWSTMHALTRALQSELGIAPQSDSFGPATLAALTARGDVRRGEPDARLVRVVQAGCACKGYAAGAFDGVFGDATARAVDRLRTDAGLPATGTLSPKVFRALLTMDAYVLVPGGTAPVRAVQRWLNGRYLPRALFAVVPCDGRASRELQKALVLALQYEVGLSDAEANGTFGPATQAGLRARGAVGPGSADGAAQFVHLFQAALLLQGRRTAFDGRFTTSTATTVRAFQAFCALPVTGRGDFPTWASLLVSTGDPERPVTAADCVTTITGPRATALRRAGYRVVGRYLTNAPGSSLDKQLRPAEPATILGAGLRLLPIYQTSGGSAAYFTAAQGRTDARLADEAARRHRLPAGALLYFACACDYDATDADLDARVLPYFTGVRDGLAAAGSRYRHGVYGSRNVCARVSAATGAAASFVSGMSTGYSGNAGYPLPDNWAFDQIATVRVGTGPGAVEIDRDAHRPARDPGVGALAPLRQGEGA